MSVADTSAQTEVDTDEALIITEHEKQKGFSDLVLEAIHEFSTDHDITEKYNTFLQIHEKWPSKTPLNNNIETRKNKERFTDRLYAQDIEKGLITIRHKDTGRVIFKKEATQADRIYLQSVEMMLGRAVIMAAMEGPIVKGMLDGARITNISMTGLIKRGIKDRGVWAVFPVFTECSMRNIHISAEVTSGQFFSCDMTHCYLERMHRCRFELSNLQMARIGKLNNCSVFRSNMVRARVSQKTTNSFFDNVLAPFSTFNNVDMGGAKFRMCIMNNARFRGTTLDALFERSQLTKADFTRASGKKLVLTGTSAFGANLDFIDDGLPSIDTYSRLTEGKLTVFAHLTRSDGFEYYGFVGPLGGVVIRAGCRTWTCSGRRKAIYTARTVRSGAFGDALRHCETTTAVAYQKEAIAIIRFMFDRYKEYLEERKLQS